MLACGATVALVPWVAGDLAWWLDLGNDLALQAGFGAAVAVGVAAALRTRVWAAVAAALFVLHGARVAPQLVPGARAPDEGPRLRVLLANVHTSNREYERFAELVEALEPDVVGVLEVDAGWAAALEGVFDDQWSRLVHPRRDNFGIALYSRLPTEAEELALVADVPSIRATVQVHGADVGLLLTHPLPPISAEYQGWRNEQLAALPGALGPLGDRVVVLGDLNATPWSAAYRRLVRDAGLTDSRRGFGLQPSWPAGLPWPLRIPIDHVLVRGDLEVAERRLERPVGSDHLPVYVELVVR